MNGEDAFLASLGGEDYSAPYDQAQQDEEDEEDDYDPSSFLPNDDNDISQSATPQIATSTLSPLPPSLSENPSRAASRMSNLAVSSAQKPTTVGGFITEDSDDEGTTSQAPQTANAQAAVNVASIKSPSQAPAASVSQTPVPANTQVYDPPQDNGASQVVANGTADSVSAAHVSAPSFDGAPEGNPVEAAPLADASAPSKPVTSAPAIIAKARLPYDIIGQFTDRIEEDPKGDVDAWLGLIGHYRSKGRIDEARKTYSQFFEIFPTSADHWVAYAQLEQEQDDLPKLEAIFQSSLMKVQSVPLWSIYLDHVRRRNDLASDTSGQGRQTVSQAYEFVLNQVGHDKDAGKIWQDYIAFTRAGPGTAGGTGWQDAQKMDLLRKAYQRAVCVPTDAVSTLWKEYDQFEMGLNKVAGRKNLQEKSPAYMTARSSYTALRALATNLRRGGVPKLQPMPGCEGDEDFRIQNDIWQAWIAWEKDDPLVLKDEDLAAFHQRVLHVYTQATMSLRFLPQIWYDAAEWCFNNSLEADGNEFLSQGTDANPESCLLAFKRADRMEQTMQVEDGEDGLKRKGDAVRQPYDVVLNALYALIDKVKAREPVAIARIEEEFAAAGSDSREASPDAGDSEDEKEQDVDITKPLSRKAQKERQIQLVQNGTKTHIKLISRTLTFVWIALMRSFRRIQGKGKPGEKLGGMRAIFTEARKRGRLLSDMYSSSALTEHYCYKDPAALKIFERGIKLFPDDEGFALEYIKHLISIGDVTNARSVFETTVSKITSKPENVARARPLYLFFHNWESRFGELSQITNIEKRMAELYPSDQSLSRFSKRYVSPTLDLPAFDPCSVRLIISPTQVRPKSLISDVIPTIETIQPIAPPLGYIQSPKRPLDDSDAEQPVRKLLRGDSPLKGAAGRRQQQRQAREGMGVVAPPVPLPSIPRGLPPAIHAVLAMIPPARQWTDARLDPQKMTDLLRSVDLGRAPASAAPGYGVNYG